MAKMKVVQCWDDGVTTDIRLMEILRKYNAKATFNLNPGLMQEEREVPYWNHDPFPAVWNHMGFRCGKVGLKEIREIYSGFQVASHCWQHEVAGAVDDEVFIAAAVKARTYLEDVFERPCTGFAYPCGAFTPSTVELLRQAGFSYGRTVMNVQDVRTCDPLALHSHCHFMNSQFYRLYEEAKKTGVFYFWGHSYETLDFEQLWIQLEDKIRYISEDPDSEWADVADIVPLCHAGVS